MSSWRWVLVGLSLVVFVGGWQWLKLRGLEEERVLLRNEKEKLVGSNGLSSNQSGVEKGDAAVQGLTKQEVEVFCDDVVELFLKAQNGEVRGEEMRERFVDFLRRAKGFSADNITELVLLLKENRRVPWKMFADEVLGEFFVQAVPFEMMSFLKANRDLEGWESLWTQAFSKCLQQDPTRGLKMYEEGVAAGNADFQTTTIRSRLLSGLVRDYPEKMLKLAQSKEFQDDPDALMHLGGFVDDRLETTQEFLSFLVTLEQAMQKSPKPEFLQTVRKDFIRESRQKIRDWSFEDMRHFASAGMNRDEQFGFIEQIRHYGDLSEPEKWAEWFLEISPKEWAQWAGDDPALKKHPLESLVVNLARRDYELGDSLLDKIPEGDFRNEVMLEFAWRLADRKPARAEVYLELLPESKGRARLAKRIAHEK